MCFFTCTYPKLCGGEFKTVDVDTAIGVSYCQGQGHKWGVKVTTLVWADWHPHLPLDVYKLKENWSICKTDMMQRLPYPQHWHNAKATISTTLTWCKGYHILNIDTMQRLLYPQPWHDAKATIYPQPWQYAKATTVKLFYFVGTFPGLTTTDMLVDTWICRFQIMFNITKVNKYFVGILNSWIALPKKDTKSNVQQIKIILCLQVHVTMLVYM